MTYEEFTVRITLLGFENPPQEHKEFLWKSNDDRAVVMSDFDNRDEVHVGINWASTPDPSDGWFEKPVEDWTPVFKHAARLLEIAPERNG